jgi:hypothetical protein
LLRVSLVSGKQWLQVISVRVLWLASKHLAAVRLLVLQVLAVLSLQTLAVYWVATQVFSAQIWVLVPLLALVLVLVHWLILALQCRVLLVHLCRWLQRQR